jgi:uncharacterized cupin superfamily protein
MPVANLFEPDWDAEQDRPPFTWRRARLGRQTGARSLGASLYELPAGAATFPFHIHHANEEMILVLAGRPTLRTLEGERELEPGEVVACPVGRAGAHRLDNRGEEPARVLIVGTMVYPEVVEYPDSGKVRVSGQPPGAPRSEDDLLLTLRVEASVDYFEGETDDA